MPAKKKKISLRTSESYSASSNVRWAKDRERRAMLLSSLLAPVIKENLGLSPDELALSVARVVINNK